MEKIRNHELLIERIKEKIKGRDAELIIYGNVIEKTKPYALYKIQSRNISKDDAVVILIAGFHGEEPAGSLIIQDSIDKIIGYANKKNIKIIIYPCVNPSGFEYNKRYNLSNEDPNNLFIYYELEQGASTFELSPNMKFIRYIEIDQTPLANLMPKESKALISDIKKLLEITLPVAVLDLHQDNEIPYQKNSKKNGFYIITQNTDKKPYLSLINKTKKPALIIKNTYLGEDVNFKIDRPKNDYGIKTPINILKKIKSSWATDKNGIMVLYDSSITDFLHKKGVRYSLVLETDINIQLKKLQKISLIWIKGIIDLASSAVRDAD